MSDSPSYREALAVVEDIFVEHSLRRDRVQTKSSVAIDGASVVAWSQGEDQSELWIAHLPGEPFVTVGFAANVSTEVSGPCCLEQIRRIAHAVVRGAIVQYASMVRAHETVTVLDLEDDLLVLRATQHEGPTYLRQYEKWY